MEVIAGSSSPGAAASSRDQRSQRSSASSTRDISGLAVTPEAKRRRSRGWSEDNRSECERAAASGAMKFKEELLGSDDESAPPSVSGASSADGVGELGRAAKAKACSGCFRSIECGRDWVNPEETVAWGHPNNRGCWCRDCFNLWRLRHSSDRSLIVFGVWLRRSENYAVWEIELIAYVSLVAEGISRVSSEALAKRVDLLKWLSSFLCIPFNITEVVPLFAIPQQADRQQPMNPAFLTTTIVDGMQRLAMHTPTSKSSDERSLLVERPAFSETMTRLPARRWFATDIEEDHNLLGRSLAAPQMPRRSRHSPRSKPPQSLRLQRYLGRRGCTSRSSPRQWVFVPCSCASDHTIGPTSRRARSPFRPTRCMAFRVRPRQWETRSPSPCPSAVAQVYSRLSCFLVGTESSRSRSARTPGSLTCTRISSSSLNSWRKLPTWRQQEG